MDAKGKNLKSVSLSSHIAGLFVFLPFARVVLPAPKAELVQATWLPDPLFIPVSLKKSQGPSIDVVSKTSCTSLAFHLYTSVSQEDISLAVVFRLAANNLWSLTAISLHVSNVLPSTKNSSKVTGVNAFELWVYSNEGTLILYELLFNILVGEALYIS